MKNFDEAFAHVDKLCYAPNQWIVESVREEAQNSEYGAGRFQLNAKSVRFRVAKITPAKIGQFVAFWEKDENNKNRAFSYDGAADLWVINTFDGDHRFGQFVFPKEVLLRQQILRTASAKGKMAIRIYPEWENPTSRQAVQTQKWQLEYFVGMDTAGNFSRSKLLELYAN
ncbi:MepB family protein [Saccharibacillus qingshengii]|uniref:MepB family protein n=1 Tax=Saccharibacillus qingshengii TaxID=1763540 RepID=UPI0015541F9F